MWKTRTKYSSPDDEYYTSYETAKRFLEPVLPLLKNKKVVCPFDNENSYIYIYKRK